MRMNPLEQAYHEIIEPQLARRESVILYDWPADQAALAKVREDAHPGIHRFAERFEWFVRGVELANGYHELTDAQELLNASKTQQPASPGGRDAGSARAQSTDGCHAARPACLLRCGPGCGSPGDGAAGKNVHPGGDGFRFLARVGMLGKRGRPLQDSDGWDWPGFGQLEDLGSCKFFYGWKV